MPEMMRQTASPPTPAAAPPASGRIGAGGGTDRLFVESAARAFRVLEAFAGRPGPLSLGEIAAATGLDRSAVQRSAHTLLRLGYLRQAGPRGGLLPGLRILDRSFDCMRSEPLYDRAVPVMIELRRETQERVDLTVFDDLTMLYAFRLQARRETYMAGLAGSRIPTWCSSGGRAVMAFLPPQRVEDILARSDRRKITPHTVVDIAALRERIGAVRQVGYALAVEELQLGILAIGAPVMGPNGLPIAAVQITASRADHDPEEMARRFGPLVAEAARSIGAG
jgi:DNA-binding IclR family transcriptional regulator